ncbi:PaaI family thioesterase [Ferdinandcohnia quinoae]|uniref:PaaI family thioesterase n=1 Tax=Fredinandcohnia quinoae TaxID=2918902 RepID=A0AAW5E1B9_9BACI|nr:PaaI family thioesterase [Fredinandcohnia sp. SECRCQ15]MCH1623907.1 PaaI family thioesterase [Fredinandcohnia sp. SECRCQ15]
MKDRMKQKLETFINSANEEELHVMELVMDGVIRKHSCQNNSYLGGLLQAHRNIINDTTYEMTIPNTEIVQNALQIVHGGITATLLDSAMGSLVHHILPDDKACVTTEMKINYVAPGIGKELRCIATLIHKGSKICVTEGKVFRDDGKLIAHATASFFIINRNLEELLSK